MNRGHERKRIFAGDRAKDSFLKILAESGGRLQIRILAYCLMDSHYHLVVENSSGRLADFFKLVNGEFGIDYRRHHGGAGAVFQGRYRSTLIQDDGYLLMAISYVLGNPARAGLVKSLKEYPWSSAALYFKTDSPEWVDCRFVEELYGSGRSLASQVHSRQGRKAELPVNYSEFGAFRPSLP